jgi:hypothetical protein
METALIIALVVVTSHWFWVIISLWMFFAVMNALFDHL